MKKVTAYVAMFLLIFFSSCASDSDWEKIVISANQKLIFSEPEQSTRIKYLIIPINGGDTLFVKNLNLVYRVCYIRAAYPEKDIIIECAKTKKDGKKVFDPRFINLPK